MRRVTRVRNAGLVTTLLGTLVLFAAAQQTPAASPLVVSGLGKSTIPLDGLWQYHLGDDLAWADPAFDDSHWEQITADEPWGMQGHFAYTGFAWYRRALDITPTPGASSDLALFVPEINDVYEIYWNGQLIASHGHMPPQPVIFYPAPAQTFGMGPARRGVLAVRVWTGFLASQDTGLGGGFAEPMAIGSPDAVGALKAQADYRWLQSRALFIGIYSLFGLLGLLAFGLWIRDRSQALLMWASCYLLGILGENVFGSLFVPWPWHITASLNGIFNCAVNVSLWYLSCWLLDLRGNRRLMRLTRIVAFVAITAGVLDAAAAYFLWRTPYRLTAQVSDAVFTFLYVPFGLWNLAPVSVALFGRRKLHRSRWLFASVIAFSSTYYMVFVAAAEGRRFTHWTLADTLSAPLFQVLGSDVNMQTIADSLLLFSLVYAIYRFSAEGRDRQAALEQDLQNARQLQQVLIPESLPEISGFTLTSAYKPALEVGGDFFQIISLADGSTLIVLGDVSGKGLKAAMAVSLIVGLVRALAPIFSEPGKLLAEVNDRLVGRLHGGFATALALRLDAAGKCALACAGHLPPFLNDRELDLPGALPLGIAAEASYDETALQLNPADCLALYTDGLLEARSVTGELYGFDRLRTLFAADPTADQATEAAVAFGQDDDITVLTLTRLGAGEASTLHHTARLPAM